MRPEGVSCSTCAWGDMWSRTADGWDSESLCRKSPERVKITEGHWCAHWAHGRIEVEAGRLVVREVSSERK